MKRMTKSLKITYDESVDAAYVYLTEIPVAGVAKTYCCNSSEVGGMINLDFDSDGQLLGVEVLGASRKLPRHLLSP